MSEGKNYKELYEKSHAECEQLRHELRLLKGEENQTVSPVIQPEAILPLAPSPLSVNDKIQLFKSYFKGRDDIYAYYWEAPNGKKGYAPARSKDKKTLYPLTDKI
ncbi:MAG: hypothetical protein HRT88_19520, partial [Lentisphaeraceae bacterium]|nr:hypothetical protein [Lentisphaeraceae bacterium]